jgi:two-component system OmpR family response regulator
MLADRGAAEVEEQPILLSVQADGLLVFRKGAVTSMKTILIVDDDANVRRSVRYVLKSQGYRVVEAASGVAALRQLTKEPADLVVLDLVMPQMDGTEVCDRMKSDPTLSQIPVLIFTMVRGEVCRDWSRYIKANAYMNKPFQVKELLEAVRELLGSPAGNETTLPLIKTA